MFILTHCEWECLYRFLPQHMQMEQVCKLEILTFQCLDVKSTVFPYLYFLSQGSFIISPSLKSHSTGLNGFIPLQWKKVISPKYILPLQL